MFSEVRDQLVNLERHCVADPLCFSAVAKLLVLILLPAVTVSDLITLGTSDSYTAIVAFKFCLFTFCLRCK